MVGKSLYNLMWQSCGFWSFCSLNRIHIYDLPRLIFFKNFAGSPSLQVVVDGSCMPLSLCAQLTVRSMRGDWVTIIECLCVLCVLCAVTVTEWLTVTMPRSELLLGYCWGFLRFCIRHPWAPKNILSMGTNMLGAADSWTCSQSHDSLMIERGMLVSGPCGSCGSSDDVLDSRLNDSKQPVRLPGQSMKAPRKLTSRRRMWLWQPTETWNLRIFCPIFRKFAFESRVTVSSFCSFLDTSF